MAIVSGERVRAPRTLASDRRPRTPKLRRDLRAILADGASFSVMVGIGETYLPAFVLAAGMGEVAAGLITTVPLVAGALLQLASPAAIRRLGSNRRWVVCCALTQALAFVPLVVAAWFDWGAGRLAFLMAAVYWGAGMAAGSAWNTWVGTIVPGTMRAAYFARRTRISQAGVLVGFLAGGFALQAGQAYGHVLPTFAALFLTAAVCRLFSAAFLASQSEPVPPSPRHREVPLRELLGRLRGGHDTALLIYLLSVQAAAQIAGPYFTPFMLKQEKFTYVDYVLLIGASFAAKVAALPALGRYAQHYGARRLLWIGGIAIIPCSGLWIVDRSFGFLLAIQILAGFAWAAYELAMFLLFFESIPESERTSVLTTFNLGNALATVLGSLIGGLLLRLGDKSYGTYLAIFGLSSAARLATMVFLSRVHRTTGQSVPIGLRTVELRADTGIEDLPILASLPQRPVIATVEE
jgi:MFS family permease